MFEIGDTLREARIRQGLTLKDVEDSLKIRGKYLQALEDDDFEVLPGRTFVRAFLRTYATYLGLEADVLVAEYETSQGVPSASHRNRQVSGLPRSAGCLLYTSDAADDLTRVDLGGRRIITK